MSICLRDYLLRVQGAAATPTTIQFAATPVTFVDLALGGRRASPVTTPQTQRLFSLHLASACTARIETYTAPGSTGPANDTYVVLYDRNFRVLALGDDPVTYFTPGRLEVPLPAGTYYVGAQFFYDDVGTFDIEADCSLPFPSVPVATSGPNSVTCPGSGGIGLLALDACTAESVTILATGPLNAGERWYWTVMDETGLCTGIGGYDTIKRSPVPQWGDAVRGAPACRRDATTRWSVGRSGRRSRRRSRSTRRCSVRAARWWAAAGRGTSVCWSGRSPARRRSRSPSTASAARPASTSAGCSPTASRSTRQPDR